MKEKPYILLIATPGSIANYALTLQRVRQSLPGKVELIFTFQNGAAIGFTSDMPAEEIHQNVQPPLKDIADLLILEIGQDWSAMGFNVAYRWFRENVYDPSLRPPA